MIRSIALSTRELVLQVTYSPLQGSVAKSTTAAPMATSNGVTGSQQQALGIDSSRIWMDGISCCPLPCMGIAATQDGSAAQEHCILFSNTAALVMTGQDSKALFGSAVEPYLGFDNAALSQWTQSLACGCQFTTGLAAGQEDDMSGHLVVYPLTTPLGGNAVVAHLVIFMQGHNAMQLYADKLKTIVTAQDLDSASFEVQQLPAIKVVRIALLASGSANEITHAECDQGQRALVKAYNAAAVCRAEGKRPLSALPNALDPVAWVEYFDLCLSRPVQR